MSVVQQIQGKERDLGEGFLVTRLLPAATRRSVGPFVFLDHFGPTRLGIGAHMDVGPHPHIGLATVTFLFDGAITHRDSLGYVQRIEPGAINWMCAGRGIVHSERTPEDLRTRAHSVHGVQLWVALPMDQEEREPDFAHTPAHHLPQFDAGGVAVRVLLGSAFGYESPVVTASPTVFLWLRFSAASTISLPPMAAELAVYVVEGAVDVAEERLSRGTLAVLDSKLTHTIRSALGGEVILIGGAPLDAPRFLWWNFVSSNRERIRAASANWAAQRFARVPGENEWVRLPAEGFKG